MFLIRLKLTVIPDLCQPCSLIQARLALAEKEIPYKSRLINPFLGEEHTEWYIKKNPKTTVPTMEHRGKLLTDSRDIIEYVDTLPSNSELV